MPQKLAVTSLATALALSGGIALLHGHSSASDRSSSVVRTGHPIDGGPPVYPPMVARRPLPTAIHPITPR